MKKILAVLLVTVFAVSMLGACGTNQNMQTPQGQNEAQAQQTQQPNTQQPTDAEKQNFIGEERAKEIALEKAGITAEGVVFDRVELDFDDGVWQYEVEFRKDRTEYDADIKAADGTVLKWDVDLD